MTDSCYCYYEPFDAMAVRRPISRKNYACTECGNPIDIGERYEYVRGLYDGGWSTYRTCYRCLMIRDLMEAHFDCFCWEYGNFLENACEHLSEVGDKVPGLRMAIGRILVEMNRLRSERHLKQLKEWGHRL